MPELKPSPLFGSVRAWLVRARGRFSALMVTRPFSWMAIVLVALVVTAVTTVSFQQIPAGARVGQIVARDIKADRNYEIVDQEATAKIREEAMQSVLPVFDFDRGLAARQAVRIREAFDAMRALLKKGERQPVSAERIGEMKALFAQKLSVVMPEDSLRQLAREGFSTRSEGILAGLVTRAMAKPLAGEGAAADIGVSERAIVRTIDEGKEQGAAVDTQLPESEVELPAAFTEIAKARDALEKSDLSSMGVADRKVGDALAALAALALQPNLTFNRAETSKRREEAAAGTKDVLIKLNAGEMIVREGSRLDPWHLKVLAGMRDERRSTSSYLEFIGTFMLVLCFLVLPFMSVEKFFRRSPVSRSDHVLMTMVGLSVLLMMRFSFALAPAVRDSMLLTINAWVLHYAVPVAGGAMLIRMFLKAEVSFVFALVLAIFAGLFVEASPTYVAYCLITSLAAVMAIANADRRSHIIRAGVVTGAAGVVAVLGIRLIISADAPIATSVAETLWCMVFALLSGIGCAIYTMIAAPIVESFSGYTSDIKLLELANLNHPLLRELVVRAPGTYHHSHLVGLLGEAAATEIGANALLVRVGAYYHDIGKLKKPLYFVENTKPGENRHDKLSPNMSALIVSAHVKEGVDLAAESKIPKVISDMIPQHHGTRLISFFYDKAKAHEDPSMQKIDEKDFRYPGPKPQTREAAILMLADVTEASVRALKEKSPARIEQTVVKTIHDIFNETQLDECDLTLRDLDLISKAFTRTLLGIYHARIEYAKEVENEKEKEREKQAQQRDAGGNKGDSPERSS